MLLSIHFQEDVIAFFKKEFPDSVSLFGEYVSFSVLVVSFSCGFVYQRKTAIYFLSDLLIKMFEVIVTSVVIFLMAYLVFKMCKNK